MRGTSDKRALADDVERITIRLAGDEEIRRWSAGEVRRPATVDSRSGKPVPGGLFCQRIFGPEVDYSCACSRGGLSGVEHAGATCPTCQVRIESAEARRRTMGHIELASSVVHLWGVRLAPFPLARLLGLPARLVERIVYYEAYLVESSETPELSPGQIIEAAHYLQARGDFGQAFRVVSGGEAVLRLFERIDLPATARALRQRLAKSSLSKTAAETRRHRAMIDRLRLIESLIDGGVDPRNMVLTAIPVIPPALRPMLTRPSNSGGIRLAAHDLNAHYLQILRINERIVRLKELQAPGIMVRAEQRRLQEAVDGLFDNQLARSPLCNASQRPLQSLGCLVKGKSGRFRKNLLGKRVDYSGRAVIVPGPALGLDECGLPRTMALELFRPLLLSRLQTWIRKKRKAVDLEAQDEGMVHPLAWARKKLAAPDALVWDLLSQVAANRLVLLNRAPTLHRHNLQAFRPVLVDGNAIQVHPLVCAGFNADFDGDTMAVHVPLSDQALAEAERLLPTRQLFSPASGRLVPAPSQDAVLGCYYLSAWIHGDKAPGAGTLPGFAHPDQVLLAWEAGRLRTHDLVVVRISDGRAVIDHLAEADSTQEDSAEKRSPGRRVVTTVGRVLLHSALPQVLPFYNFTFTAHSLALLLEDVRRRCGDRLLTETIDRLARIGFTAATRSGMSFAVEDLLAPDNKKQVIDDSLAKDAELRRLGAEATRSERLALWRSAQQAIHERLKEQLRDDKRQGAAYLNPIYAMADSGARSKWVQIRQLAALRGLMARASGDHDTHDRPILSSLREGLSTWEFFLSVYGARKAGADKASLPETGYLTRKLVDVAHQAIIAGEDCGSTRGVEIETVGEVCAGRISLVSIDGPHGEPLVQSQQPISRTAARRLSQLGIQRIAVRSPLTCRLAPQLCARCYGFDLSTDRLVETGAAVGVIAAQSVGEPGMQLAMNTKHTGGVADRVSGLQEVLRLFDSPASCRSAVDTNGEAAGSERTPLSQQLALVEQLTQVYRQCKVTVDPRHFEVLVAQMARRLEVVDPGDSGFYAGEIVEPAQLASVNSRLNDLLRIVAAPIDVPTPDAATSNAPRSNGSPSTRRGLISGRIVVLGQIVERQALEDENRRRRQSGQPPLAATPLRPAVARPKLSAAAATALASESFLSAASFERASRVLFEAALAGRTDPLRGLKENVLLGRRIPAGSGFRQPSDEGQRSLGRCALEDGSPPIGDNGGGENRTEAASSAPQQDPPRRHARMELNYSGLSDEQLLARYYDANDHLAFEELDLRYRSMLARSAYYKLGRLVGRRQIADDLASETLVKMVETRGKSSAWDRQRAVKPWLFTILHNCIASFVRVKHNQTATLSDLEKPSLEGEETSLAEVLPAESPTAEEGLLADALEAELAAAIPEVAAHFSGPSREVALKVLAGGLSDRGRRVLQSVDDLSPAERAVVIDGLGHRLDQQTIAQMHKVSPAQVSKVLKRARAELAQRLGASGLMATTLD